MSLLRTDAIRPLAGIGLIALACMTLSASRDFRSQSPSGTGTGIVGDGGAWDAALRAAGNVDVNQADAAELERLPGVGRVLAGRIVAERQRRGRFTGPGALLRVPGIGPKTLEAFENYITFE